ncbi:MAG: tetratricopeptide repeat protein [Magnetococcales bacterium]|nr:tetratricopeptide repeat protein [Magnetococcales bacterium]
MADSETKHPEEESTTPSGFWTLAAALTPKKETLSQINLGAVTDKVAPLKEALSQMEMGGLGEKVRAKTASLPRAGLWAGVVVVAGVLVAGTYALFSSPATPPPMETTLQAKNDDKAGALKDKAQVEQALDKAKKIEKDPGSRQAGKIKNPAEKTDQNKNVSQTKPVAEKIPAPLTAGTKVTVITLPPPSPGYDLPAEKMTQLEKKLGMTRQRLEKSLKHLKKRGVPQDKVEARLEKMAQQFHHLATEIDALNEEDHNVTRLIKKAQHLLERGEKLQPALKKSLGSTLGKQGITQPNIDQQLEAFASQHQNLKTTLARFQSGGKGASRLIQQARALLKENQFRKAKKLIPEARQTQIEKTIAFHEETEHYSLQAAALAAANGQLQIALFDTLKAIESFQEAIDLTPNTAIKEMVTYQDLMGAALMRSGRFDLAEAHFETAALMDKIAHPPKPLTSSFSLDKLALSQTDRPHHQEAELFLELSLKIKKLATGENSLFVMEALGNLAGFFNRKGQPEKAEQLYQQALTTLEANYPDLPVTRKIRNDYSIFLLEAGRKKEATMVFDRE